MKIKDNIIISISFIIVLFCLTIDLIPDISLTTSAKLQMYIFSMFIIWLNMKLNNRKISDATLKEKNTKKNLSIIFTIYTILISTLLFLDEHYGRYRYINNIKFLSKEHFELYSNFIPFKTILTFLERLQQNTINTSIVLTNLLGNIIVFAPYGIIVPILFKEKFSKIKNFTVLMIMIVLAVECIQFITRRGSFDIDDLILNVVGAVLFLGLMKIKVIGDFVKKILLWFNAIFLWSLIVT